MARRSLGESVKRKARKGFREDVALLQARGFGRRRTEELLGNQFSGLSDLEIRKRVKRFRRR